MYSENLETNQGNKPRKSTFSFRFKLNQFLIFFSFLKVFRKKDELKKEMNLSSFFYVIDGQWN